LPPPKPNSKTALIVNPDMTAVSSLQSAFVQNDITAIVARDLPTALLAITQHYFDVAVVASRISEEGDGWSLGGVIRLVFPKSFVLMIAPGTDLITLKTAINHGVDEVLDQGSTPEQIVSTAVHSAAIAGKRSVTPKERIQ
jgi:ActR/RegA family two-component response regulator